MIWPNGSSYEGNFLQGEKHGFGRFKSFNGEEYTGFWEFNKREGEGIHWEIRFFFYHFSK